MKSLFIYVNTSVSKKYKGVKVHKVINKPIITFDNLLSPIFAKFDNNYRIVNHLTNDYQCTK
jgi:hypothetical protein